MSSPPDICPNCGATVPDHAKACPECGSCEETGWSDKAYADNLGIPDDEFDYENFIKEEFGGESDQLNQKTKLRNMIISGVLLAGLIWWIL